MDRRRFLSLSGTVFLASALRSPSVGAAPRPAPVPPPAATGRYLKSVKWGMIQSDGDLVDKFTVMKELGYDGLELISPLGGLSIEALLKASQVTGMPIHGVVDEVHWTENHRLSSPDEEARERGRAALEQAIRDAHALGGSSVLLVPGVVTKDVSHDDVWARSTEQVRQVLPLCARYGVHVLIENVWNGFCYQPEQMRDYIDGFQSPWVGAYLDLGNHIKYGKPEHWVRTLGRRVVKLDVKDWGEKNGFCKIGDGDANWTEIDRALVEIGFSGWATAEVSGGGRERLADIKTRMDKALP